MGVTHPPVNDAKINNMTKRRMMANLIRSTPYSNVRLYKLTPTVMTPDATPEDEKLYANYGETPFLGGVLSR
jgi:hypothetical protein